MERRKFTREFKLEAVRLIKQRGVSYAQASQDLSVHQSQLRSWVKALAADPQHAFPGQGQMKPEQAKIAQLKRESDESGTRSHKARVPRSLSFNFQFFVCLIHSPKIGIGFTHKSHESNTIFITKSE